MARYWLLYAVLTGLNFIALYAHYLFAHSTWSRLQDMRDELEATDD